MTEKTLPRDRTDAAANRKIPALTSTFRTTIQKLPDAIFHRKNAPEHPVSGPAKANACCHRPGYHRRSVSISGPSCHPPCLIEATFSDYTDKLSDSIWRKFCWFPPFSIGLRPTPRSIGRNRLSDLLQTSWRICFGATKLARSQKTTWSGSKPGHRFRFAFQKGSL